MATYKVIQDIEAEDKILGPLTLRQFIFAILALFLSYMCYVWVHLHLLPLLIIFLPAAIFFGFFAMPFGRDQPTEIWALAKLRYYFKPRQRIWNQSGIKELVTITVPKKIEPVLSNGLSQTEVQSRLKALATTIDTRGWVVKHAGNVYATPIAGNGQRLIDFGSLPASVPDDDIVPADDMLDAYSNPVAQQFTDMISQSSQQHRQQLIDEMNSVQASRQQPEVAPANYWFMNDSQMSGAQMPSAQAPITQAVNEDENKLAAELHSKAKGEKASYGHMRTMKPLSGAPPPVTPPADPAILSLANNDDLNVATLAREAKKAKDEDTEGEVVIPLR